MQIIKEKSLELEEMTRPNYSKNNRINLMTVFESIKEHLKLQTLETPVLLRIITLLLSWDQMTVDYVLQTLLTQN